MVLLFKSFTTVFTFETEIIQNSSYEMLNIKKKISKDYEEVNTMMHKYLEIYCHYKSPLPILNL